MMVKLQIISKMIHIQEKETYSVVNSAQHSRKARNQSRHASCSGLRCRIHTGILPAPVRCKFAARIVDSGIVWLPGRPLGTRSVALLQHGCSHPENQRTS